MQGATTARIEQAPRSTAVSPWPAIAGLGGVLLGLVAFPVLGSSYLSGPEPATIVTVCWAVLAAGLFEWTRRPAIGNGPLLPISRRAGC